MRILAIDPGYDRIGVAVLEKVDGKEKLLFSSCIVTEKSEAFASRLGVLASSIKGLISEWQPNYCALEKLFFNKNQKTAMQVAEARGAIMQVAYSQSLEVLEFSPSEVKLAVTSSGNASKAQVADMVKRLVSLTHLPKYDDEYDAIAVGLAALASLKSYPQSRV